MSDNKLAVQRLREQFHSARLLHNVSCDPAIVVGVLDYIAELEARAEAAAAKHGAAEAAYRDSWLDAIACIAELEARLTIAEKVIAWANNSLFGSHNFFLSLDGGPPDEHHLDRPIEKMKWDKNEPWRRIAELEARAEAAEEELSIWKSVFPDIAPERVLPDRAKLEARIADLEARLARAPSREEVARAMMDVRRKHIAEPITRLYPLLADAVLALFAAMQETKPTDAVVRARQDAEASLGTLDRALQQRVERKMKETKP